MKKLGIAALCLTLAVPLGAATADPWKDESGKGRERKVEYDDGRCKVERKWGKHGEYKEEIKCRDGHPGYGYGGHPPHGYGAYPGYYGYGYR